MEGITGITILNGQIVSVTVSLRWEMPEDADFEIIEPKILTDGITQDCLDLIEKE